MLNITATVDLPYTACQPFSTSNIQQSQRGAAQSGCQPPECNGQETLQLKDLTSKLISHPQSKQRVRQQVEGSARATLPLVCRTCCLLARWVTHLHSVGSGSVVSRYTCVPFTHKSVRSLCTPAFLGHTCFFLE